MKPLKLFSFLLVFLALVVLAVFLFFIFRKPDTKKETEETKTEETTKTQPVLAGNVLNVVTHLSNDRVNLLASGLGNSYLLDARSKANSYTFNGVTVSVVSGEVSNQPGYSKYTHTLPKGYKGSKLVFDGETTHEAFEDPVTKLTTYFWFNTLLFMTFTTQSEGEAPALKYYHFSSHVSNNTLKWDRFDREPTTELDPSVLVAKLDEVNLAAGNVVALHLDEYLEEATGSYSTTLNSVTSKVSLLRRSSSSTGFVKVTHKLMQEVENGNSRPFKLRKLRVSGTELADLALTTKPVVSMSVFWWYNMPLLAELDLHGGDREHLAYNVDTNNWEKENVEKLRAKLFLLKNKLGEPVTVDLSKSGDHDQTYTSNAVLVRVSPGATALREVKKYTHRFTTGNAHFVGSFVNSGTAQLGLPVMRVVEVAVYYVKGVPLLLKVNLATAGSLASKFRYYTSNGYRVWTVAELTKEVATTEALLKKLNEENQRLLQENDKYVLDAMMLANYMSTGRVVEVTKETLTDMPGYYVYKHQAFNGVPFKLEKFTVGGKDVGPSVATVEGVTYAKMYLFLNMPLLLHAHVPPAAQGLAGADTYFSFNATTTEWTKTEADLSSAAALKEHLSKLRGTMSSVSLNLGHTEGEYKSGMVTVQVVEATPYENDPPTSYTKRVHVLTPAFPVDVVKHFDFNLVLAKKETAISPYETPSKDPLLPKNFVVSKAEVYYFGDVPLYFTVHGTHGTPLRFSNVFRGTLWREDDMHTRMSLSDMLVALSAELRAAARFDVCKDAPSDTVVTYKLRHLGSKETTNVTVTKTEGADGVTLLAHKMPESVTLKFTTLTCGEHVLTGLSMDDVSKVFLYRRYKAPLFLKLNSDPRFFALSGDGGLTRYVPPAGATDMTEEQVKAKVSELSTMVGKVFDLDLMSKADYTLLNSHFTVTETTVGGFKRRLHALKTAGRTPLAFTLRSLVHGTKDAVVYPTGLRVAWVAVFFKNDEPFYLQVKETSRPVVAEPPAVPLTQAPSVAAVPGTQTSQPAALPGTQASQPAALPAQAPPSGGAAPATPGVNPAVPAVNQPAAPAPGSAAVPAAPVPVVGRPGSTVVELPGPAPGSPGAPAAAPQPAPAGPPAAAAPAAVPGPADTLVVTGSPGRGPQAHAARDTLDLDDTFGEPADTGKHHHFVNDSGLWLPDGVYEHFEEEDMGDRLEGLKDGLGNEFSLDLSEKVDNPLFEVDMADFAPVPGFTKHTYNPKKLEYPLLLKDLKVAETEVNLPFADKHLKRFSAYSFRKNFLFFHSVSHDDKDEFFKTNFAGSFEKVEFDVYNEGVLKKELEGLKKRLGNMVSLDMANKTSYEYHSYLVNVVKQREDLEGFDKYLHDLTDNGVSVPLKLVSVRNNGHVTNVPSLEDLVYFVYVYMSEDEPLLLELHTSSPERSDYDYYYFGNTLGNWELLENPSLGQLEKAKLKEALLAYKDKMSKTYKVDLLRKFTYRLTNEANANYVLDAAVEEDPRETVGFSMYSHTFALNAVPGATVSATTAPTASVLGGATATAAEAPAPAEGPAAPASASAAAAPSAAAGAGASTVPASVVPTTAENASDAAADSTATGGQPRTARLTTYQTLKANALRAVNTMAANLPVAGKFVLGEAVLRGLAVDTLLKANVYWYHDKSPALVHVNNGVDNKYYVKKGKTFVLSRKGALPLARSELVSLLNEARENLAEPVDLDLDKSSDFDTHVKYVSNGLTLKVVPTYSLGEGFKGFKHFSATHYERAFKVATMSLWGDVVLNKLPKGHVKSATVFTDGDLLPLAVELEWTVVNNMSFVKKYNYWKNTGGATWVAHATANASERMVDDDLLTMLKAAKTELGARVVLSLDKRVNYGTAPLVTVAVEPTSRPENWNGFHRVTHSYTNAAARVVMLKLGDRVLRTLHVATYVKAVDTYWFKNALLLVRATVAGNTAAGTAGTAASPDTYMYFKNDHKDDLMAVDAPADATAATLSVTTPHALLAQLAVPFRDHYHLDVAEKTLKNAVGFVKLLPALHVVDTSVPPGYARYNLYVLDHVQGLELGKMLYHGKDFSTGNFSMPTGRVHSVYAFSPVGHFSPLFLELHVRGPEGLVLYYYHLNQHGDWMKLETGGRRLTHAELYGKLSLLSTKFGNVTVVDLAKTEGSYYGLNKTDVTKYEFPGAQGFNKYLHRAHDAAAFTVSKFVNKGVVLGNLPVLKVLHVAVYTTRDNRPMLLELKVGGRYRFFASNANGEWFEERLPSGDLRAALDAVYDEHNEVARLTGDLVTLHLHTGFVREYVLTEGTVADYEGAVAVVEDEPEPEPAPPAERLLPEDPESAEPTVQAPAGAAVVKTVLAPLPPVKRSHVLNPETFVESDRLAYSYASHGKSVYVARRDEVFRGLNVTVHRLANSEPFTLRRLVFLGRQFDLGLGAEKFLSSTLFAYMNKPLVLKLVALAGGEKYYAFDFGTQDWTPFEAADLEEKLDALNYKENKTLVLDLAKEEGYTVNTHELVVSKATFATAFTKVATKLKTAVEEAEVRKAKRKKVRAKREVYKRELHAEMEKKKAALDKMAAEAERRKAMLQTFRTTWKTLKPAELEQFVQLEAKVKALEDLTAEVAALAAKVENVRGTEAFADLSKALEAKKKELAALQPAVDAALRAAEYMTDAQVDELDVPNAAELKTALEGADAAVKAFRNRLDVKAKVGTAAEKVKAFKDALGDVSTLSDLKSKLDPAATKLEGLKEPGDNKTLDLAAVLVAVNELKPLLVLDKNALGTPADQDKKTKLTAAVTAVDELKSHAELAKKLEEAQSPAVTDFTELSKKPDEAALVLEKVNAALQLANPFVKNLRFAEQLKDADAKLKTVEEMVPLVEVLKTTLDGLGTLTEPDATKVKALKDALPTFAKFGQAHVLAKKYKDAFVAGADLNAELTMAAVDASKLVFDKALELLTPLKELPDTPATLKPLKEVAKSATTPESPAEKVPNPFEELKAALEALKVELPDLATDVKTKLTAVETEFDKVKALPTLAAGLKRDLDALSLTGVTDPAGVVDKVNELKTKLTEENLTKLKTAFHSSLKLKNELNDAFDLEAATVTDVNGKLDAANTVATALKSALEAVPTITEEGASEPLKKLKAALDKAAKLKEDGDKFATLKSKVEAFSAPVTHELSVAAPYRLKQLTDASAKLTKELKSEATVTLEMAEDVVKKMANGHAALVKLDEAYVYAAKFKPVYDTLSTFTDDSMDAAKFKSLQELAAKLKEALVNVVKLKEGYVALKLFKAQLVTANKLDEAVKAAEAFNELFNVSTELNTQVTTLEGFQPSDTDPDYTKAKTVLTELKKHVDKMNLESKVTTVKTVVTETQKALNEVASTLLKLGLMVGKRKYKKYLVDLGKAQNSYDLAKMRHDRYDVDPETLDSDEDASTLTKLMFVLGGLRHGGKNLSHAGLPLGTHVHTVNAFYAPNLEKPLMLQFKYRESEDEDEPVPQVLLVPPTADSLTDSQAVASTARPGTAATAESGTVRQVENLLAHAVSHTPDKVATEKAAVLPPVEAPVVAGVASTVAGAAGAPGVAGSVGAQATGVTGSTGAVQPAQGAQATASTGAVVPGAAGAGQPQAAASAGAVQAGQQAQQQAAQGPATALVSAPLTTQAALAPPLPVSEGPSPPEKEAEMKKFSYPGRFFVYDVDGTWKPFVPEKRGALREKLEELKVKHALGVNLDVGVVPGARRELVHAVNGENMKVRRVLYNSGYNMNREAGQLQGTAAKAHVVNLSDYDRSVAFFPPLKYEWFVHQRQPKTLVDNTVEQLPEFKLERLSLNGVTLPLTEEASDVLTSLNSLSVVVNELGTPLLLFAYKTTRHEAVLQHTYKALALKGEVYDVDDTFGNYHNLLYKVEHTDYAWNSDQAFDSFNSAVNARLAELSARLEPYYVVDLGAAAHYMRGQVVVNVEVAEAFGVRHVSYTPGLMPLQGEELQTAVPPFVVQKVFLGETAFKGFNLPFRDALHVSAFFAPLHYPLADEAKATSATKFPLLVEFSYRNRFNRLEHFYYHYVGGDAFELLTRTKLRLTASEVADVVRLVAYRNLRAGRFSLSRLNLDLAVKSAHVTPGHQVAVEKLVKGAPGPGQDVLNATVPDGYVVYKYSVAANDPGFTVPSLSFANVWRFAPALHSYKVFYAYVRETDAVPVLVAASYTEAASAEKKYVWVGYDGAAAAAVLTTAPPDPTSVTFVPKVQEELGRLTAQVDFLLQPRAFPLSRVDAGATVKLSPVGGVRGFPEVPPSAAAAAAAKPGATVTAGVKAPGVSAPGVVTPAVTTKAPAAATTVAPQVPASGPQPATPLSTPQTAVVTQPPASPPISSGTPSPGVGGAVAGADGTVRTGTTVENPSESAARTDGASGAGAGGPTDSAGGGVQTDRTQQTQQEVPGQPSSPGSGTQVSNAEQQQQQQQQQQVSSGQTTLNPEQPAGGGLGSGGQTDNSVSQPNQGTGSDPTNGLPGPSNSQDQSQASQETETEQSNGTSGQQLSTDQVTSHGSGGGNGSPSSTTQENGGVQAAAS